jgi:hypothetical protein
MRAWLAQFYRYYPDISQAAMNEETILGLDPNIKIPYTFQFSGGFTHSFTWGLDVQVDYVHTRDYDLIIGGNRNWALVNGAWVVKDPRFPAVARPDHSSAVARRSNERLLPRRRNRLTRGVQRRQCSELVS